MISCCLAFAKLWLLDFANATRCFIWCFLSPGFTPRAVQPFLLNSDITPLVFMHVEDYYEGN